MGASGVKTTWTKADAASEQTDAAIYEFAARRFISSHTLVCAASELSETIASQKGNSTNSALFFRVVAAAVPERLSEIKAQYRKPQNFAKHADRDPMATIDVNPEFTEALIFQTSIDVGIAFGLQTVAQGLFRLWFISRHPSIVIGAPEVLSGSRKVFGDLEARPFEEALTELRAALRDLDDEQMRSFLETNGALSVPTWATSLDTIVKAIDTDTSAPIPEGSVS